MSNSEFLAYIDIIINKGKFNATYKLALLMAISEICQNNNIDDNATFFISYQELAEIFTKIYWHGSDSYTKNNGDKITLRQGINSDKDNMIEFLKEFKAISQHTDWQLIDCKSKYYHKLIQEVAKLIKNNPVKFLQEVKTCPDGVLFDKSAHKDGIELYKGIANHFKNNPIIKEMAKQKMLDVIMQNPKNDLLDENFSKLDKFLFHHLDFINKEAL